MNEEIQEDSLRIVYRNIKSMYWISEAKLIRPDSGLSNVDNNIGGISHDLLPDNPLPVLINVTIKENYLNSFNLAKYNLLLKRIDAVDNTILRKDYAETVFSIKKQFNILAIIIGVLIGLIVIILIFLTLNPEFVNSKSNTAFLIGIKGYSQISKEIFKLLTLSVSGSLLIVSGILYLLWYLIIDEIQWYLNTSWEVLLWNFSFVLIAFELVFVSMFVLYKPKKSTNNQEIENSVKEVINNNGETVTAVETEEDEPIISENSLVTNLEPGNENVSNDTPDLTTTQSEELNSEIENNKTQIKSEEVNNTEESWEDDIT